MAEHNTLYQQAIYYDIVFGRDVGPEVDFLVEACRRHAGGAPQAVIDLASGPGYHAQEFAARGVRAVALDLREEMLAFGRDQAAARGVEVTWRAADMRDFRLDAPVDLAFTLFDGIDALTRNEDLVRHFRAVATNLAPGGLYVIDLTHPRDCGLLDYGEFTYKGERDGVRVEIRWAVNRPVADLVSGVARVEVELRAREGGKDVVLRDVAEERFLFPQEIRLLAHLSGALEPVGWYGDYDLNIPFDASPRARRMIAVLRKVEAPGG